MGISTIGRSIVGEGEGIFVFIIFDFDRFLVIANEADVVDPWKVIHIAILICSEIDHRIVFSL